MTPAEGAAARLVASTPNVHWTTAARLFRLSEPVRAAVERLKR